MLDVGLFQCVPHKMFYYNCVKKMALVSASGKRGKIEEAKKGTDILSLNIYKKFSRSPSPLPGTCCHVCPLQPPLLSSSPVLCASLLIQGLLSSMDSTITTLLIHSALVGYA